MRRECILFNQFAIKALMLSLFLQNPVNSIWEAFASYVMLKKKKNLMT